MRKVVFTVVITVLSLLTAGGVQAQQRIIEKSFSIPKGGILDLDLRFGDHIKVEAWDKEEVSFRAEIEINSGRLNEALLLDYSESQEGLHISADFDEDRLKHGNPNDCPDRAVTSSVWNRDNGPYMVCSNMIYELRVPRRAGLSLETISADIELRGLGGPVDARSISGFVDVSWYQDQGAELSMKTISGEAYSDLENLSLINKKEVPPPVGYELQGKIGRGGPRLRLESISGDIYLRKI